MLLKESLYSYSMSLPPSLSRHQNRCITCATKRHIHAYASKQRHVCVCVQTLPKSMQGNTTT